MTFSSFPALKPEAEQIEDADSHNEDGSHLSHCIAGKAHEQWENCAAEDAHNEQTADFVLLVGNSLQSSCKDDAERIAVAIAHQGHTCIDDGCALAVDEAEGCQYHHQDTDEQESPVLDIVHDETARETACSLGYEVDGADESGIVKCHASPFHQYLWRGYAGSNVNSYMTDDGDKAKQDEGIAQQSKSSGKLLAYGFLLADDWLLIDASAESSKVATIPMPK